MPYVPFDSGLRVGLELDQHLDILRSFLGAGILQRGDEVRGSSDHQCTFRLCLAAGILQLKGEASLDYRIEEINWD